MFSLLFKVTHAAAAALLTAIVIAAIPVVPFVAIPVAGLLVVGTYVATR